MTGRHRKQLYYQRSARFTEEDVAFIYKVVPSPETNGNDDSSPMKQVINTAEESVAAEAERGDGEELCSSGSLQATPGRDGSNE